MPYNPTSFSRFSLICKEDFPLFSIDRITACCVFTRALLIRLSFARVPQGTWLSGPEQSRPNVELQSCHFCWETWLWVLLLLLCFFRGICPGYGGAEVKASALPLKRDETSKSHILVNSLTPGNVQLSGGIAAYLALNLFHFEEKKVVSGWPTLTMLRGNWGM